MQHGLSQGAFQRCTIVDFPHLRLLSLQFDWGNQPSLEGLLNIHEEAQRDHWIPVDFMPIYDSEKQDAYTGL